MRRYAARLTALTLAGSLVAAPLAGCSLFGSKTPDPGATAKSLADGLTSGDLGALPLDGSAPAAAAEALKTAIGPLKDTRRTVTVGEVKVKDNDPKSATATLQWTWDVSETAADWSYPTQAQLKLADDQTWHVVWAPTLIEPKLTATEKFAVERSQGRRGEITGADGVVLMGLRDVYRVGIDKSKVTAAQAGASAQALATLLGIDPAAYQKTVTASGEKQFVVALTLRIEDPRIAGKTAAVQAIPGGAAVPDQSMLGPSATFARALLGSVGPATAEIIERSGGRVGVGDQVGLAGLQRMYDGWLAGTPGLKIKAVGTDAAGKASSRVLFTQDAAPGKPIATTIDVDAQTAAETVLAGVTATQGALVAIRPSTGEILAAANSPGTASQQVALSGRAAPGSTFKVVSSLALLRAGLTPDSPVPCEPTIVVDGRTFKNYGDYPPDRLGTIPLRQALAQSCNTAFISQQAGITQDDLADAAAALGIGVDFDLGAPSFLGSVPRQATKTEHAASMIGQAKVEASALTMAIVTGSVVKGATLVPRIIDRTAGLTVTPAAAPVATPTASPAASNAPTPSTPTPSTPTPSALPTVPPAPAKPLTDAEAQALRSMLAAVVSDGSGRLLAGMGVGGAKTGTAEYGSDSPPRVHAWMIAYRGDLAVAVYVADGEGGSRTAGPLMKAFLAAYRG
jgi:cell division protein FtsI/penicillin-binding protein 2